MIASLRLLVGRLLPTACLLSLAPALQAQAPSPGSALIFPVHDSRSLLTVVSVTNTNLQTGGEVRATFRYVNAEPSNDPLKAQHCSTVYRGEYLTPGDTISVLTACHDVPDSHGFLVVSARHPTGGYAYAHDHLVGSTLIVHPEGSAFTIQPYSFRAVAPAGSPTDADLDGMLDFDGTEYESMPRYLFADSFLAASSARLTLMHLSSDLDADVAVKLDIQNDNEFPLSITFTFRCWFELPLSELSGIFSQVFLVSTPNDPDEFDINCDGVGELETGWFRVKPLIATNGITTNLEPPALGALTAGPFDAEGGRVLWGSGTTPAEF